jgi:hypothetical protein
VNKVRTFIFGRYALMGATIVIMGVVLAWSLWSLEAKKKVLIVHRTPALASRMTSMPGSKSPRVSDWQEYHQTRDQTLRQNPDLSAKYKTLLSDISKQEENLDAAMIKSDPTVAPILAKLAALRERNTPQSVVAK